MSIRQIPTIPYSAIKGLFLFFLAPIMPFSAVSGRSIVYDQSIKTLQVVVGQRWMDMPVMQLDKSDVLNVSFDQLSHIYHRYIYHLEHCEADWTPSEDIFESDWLEGFNDNPIDDYENSLNTTQLYTHYRLQLPNEHTRLKMSGNYRLHIIDDDDGQEVACVEFRVVEPIVNVGLSATTNTDISLNQQHQQVSMTVNLNQLIVTNPEEQLITVVMQNGREDSQKWNPRPNLVQSTRLQWEHNRSLIFEGGNEYHRFEMLDMDHPTFGVDHISWDGTSYHVFPFGCEPRRNYTYDEDQDGAFYIRNSDNIENDRTCDYAWVHYLLRPARHHEGLVHVGGQWASGASEQYVMDYDEQNHAYTAAIYQKQGYYNYAYFLTNEDGTSQLLPEEGSFFETENRYQAFVYYRGTGERSWRLVGFQDIKLR